MATTSTIINNLVDKGVGTATSKLNGGSWVTTLVSSAKDQAGGLGALQPAINGALDELAAHKDEVGQISAQAFVAIVSHLALKQEDQARLIFLATAASFSERMAVLDADDAAAAKAQAANDKAWADIKRIGLNILEAAGKAAIPLLLAAL